MSPKKNLEIDELSYEQALAELEAVLYALENEDHPLEESIRLYERGQRLAQRCTDLLEKASLRVKKLTADGLADLENVE